MMKVFREEPLDEADWYSLALTLSQTIDWFRNNVKQGTEQSASSQDPEISSSHLKKKQRKD